MAGLFISRLAVAMSVATGEMFRTYEVQLP
jgi:hypothetical protein